MAFNSGEKLPLIEPHHYVKLSKIISPPKLSSDKIHENVAAVFPYIRQKVKMWGVDILKAENFNKSLIDYCEKDEESTDDESNGKNQSNRLSRFDCIATLFASAECTVVQDIFRTISQFPIAFPLLIPELNKAEKYKTMFPLFTGPVIKWETSNGTLVENHLFEDPFKMIVVVRIGSSHKGKSTIINQLMNSNYMFTSCNEPGAEYGIPHMVSGSIEFVCLTEETCGSGLWNNVFKNYYEKEEKKIVLLANLHGDALNYPDQIEFLKQFPSCFLIFLMPGYDETQKDKFKNLISPDKTIYIYVDPDNKDKNEKHKIYTNKLLQYREIKKVYEMFKDILALNFDEFPIVTNQLKMGKTLKFAGNIEFPESKYVVDFIKDKTCYHIKMNIMQLQKKQFEDESNSIKFWQQTIELQELIRLFAGILDLPLDMRRQALAHLEREVSRLSMEESLESRNNVILKRNELNNAGIKIDQEKDKEIRKEITKLLEKVDNISLCIDHFFRELGLVYKIIISDSDNDPKIISPNGPTKENVLKLPEYCAELLISGNTIELLGDSTTINKAWFSAICNCIDKRLPKLRVFVISILGLQSSGKSTLLNALFACKFPISAERSTKDISDQLGVNAFILIDTEGLGASEKMGDAESEKKDRMLATFAMGISNLTIINVLGESMKELTEILQIATVTVARLEKVGMSPDMIMVQHVSERNTAKLNESVQKFRDSLQEALKLIEEKDGEMVSLNPECLDILDARIKSGKLLKIFSPFKDGTTPYSPPSKKYHEDIIDLYNSIINDCEKSKSKKNFADWYKLTINYWDAVSQEYFVKNINEIYRFIELKKLEKRVTNLKKTFDMAFFQYGQSHIYEGHITGDHLLRAIHKKAVFSIAWINNTQTIRLKYFIELAEQVHNGDKDKGVQHFLNPRESIE
ncbi:32092_t:CDS:1, partial [Racocetra persica]